MVRDKELGKLMLEAHEQKSGWRKLGSSLTIQAFINMWCLPEPINRDKIHSFCPEEIHSLEEGDRRELDKCAMHRVLWDHPD